MISALRGVLLLLVGSSLWAADAANDNAKAPSVAELVAGYQQARGGAQAWRDLSTLRMTGVMQMGEVSAPMSLEYKRPGKVRLQFRVQDMPVVQAYDGERGWSAAPFVESGLPTLMFGDELAEMREMGDFDGALADYALKGNEVTLDGEEAVADTPSWRLKVVKAGGAEEMWWLAKDSLLPIRTASKRLSGGVEIGVASLLADYRAVDGLLFPFSVSNTIQRGEGTLEQIIVLERIELGMPLDDKRFAFPR